MAEVNETKMIRDMLDDPVPQVLNDDGTYTVIANGDTTGVNFRKKKLLRDIRGGVLPYQYYDVNSGRFVPGSLGGGGDVSQEDLLNLSNEVNGKVEQVTQHLAQKVDVLGNKTTKVKDQYISVVSAFLEGKYDKGTKIKTKIPYSLYSTKAMILIIKGTFGVNPAFLTLQFYKPAGGLNASFCKVSSINAFMPEIKLANENGFLVIGFTSTSFEHHSFAIDVFSPSSFTPEHIIGWTVVNEAITGLNPVTAAYQV